MWDDSDPRHQRSWKLFALALAASTSVHFAVVEVVPSFGDAPESITLEVTITATPPTLAPTPAADAHSETNPPTQNGKRAAVRRRIARVITTPVPSNTMQPGVAMPIPQADTDQPTPVESDDSFAAPLLMSPGNNSGGNEHTRAVLPPELLDAQMKAATEAYLEEQKQAACSPLARKHALAECPTAVGQDAAREANNSKGRVLPPLVLEEHALTDEELERRANIKGIQPFIIKF